MKRVWNRLRQLAFYPEEERIYVWILMGPLFLTLLLIPHMSKFAPLQLALALGSISLSWMVAIFFGLESLQVYQKVRSYEGQIENFDREKERLEQAHQYTVEQKQSMIDNCFAEMDELNRTLSVDREILTETQVTLTALEEELAQLKDRFRAVNSELKVYKSSSYTRYEVKHMVDELNRFRIREKQQSLLNHPV